MVAAPSNAEVLVAFHRFGLGVRPGVDDLRAIARDPRGFVAAELRNPPPPPPADPLLATAQDLYVMLEEQRRREREMRQAPPPAAPPPNAPKQPPPPPTPLQERLAAEVQARLKLAHAAPGCGVAERLTAFWSNHFCVAASRSAHVHALAGAYEREAIRPHALGRFGDMLLAAMRHPAMLLYLENQNSIGPNSITGLKRKRGLNENLAREALELHTLGVGGGYTQNDVAALARMLTGWTVSGIDGRLGAPGRFVFDATNHEPGVQAFLGGTYMDEGPRQAEKALRDMARKPATATHIATKFARHFIADTPPPLLVAKLAKSLRDTDGDLRALATTLVASDEAWKTPLTKIRSPYDFWIAAMRLLSPAPESTQRTVSVLNQLGQPLWNPPGPDGYADTNTAWGSPNAMKVRFDMAAAIARSHRQSDPRALLESVFGGHASAATRTAVARAESPEQGLALLLMSPEFLRR